MRRSVLSVLGSTLLIAIAHGSALAEEVAKVAAPAEPAGKAVGQTLSVGYDVGIAATLFGIFVGVGMIITARLLPLYRDMAINLRTLAGQVEGNQPAGEGDSYDVVGKASKLLTISGWIFLAVTLSRFAAGLAGWSF
jgi:hypothetical protein